MEVNVQLSTLVGWSAREEQLCHVHHRTIWDESVKRKILLLPRFKFQTLSSHFTDGTIEACEQLMHLYLYLRFRLSVTLCSSRKSEPYFSLGIGLYLLPFWMHNKWSYSNLLHASLSDLLYLTYQEIFDSYALAVKKSLYIHCTSQSRYKLSSIKVFMMFFVIFKQIVR
jgi:hypothetical protein